MLTINGRNGDGQWVQVTYEAPDGKFDGWVAAQYLTILRGGQPFDIKGLPNVWTDPDVLLGHSGCRSRHADAIFGLGAVLSLGQTQKAPLPLAGGLLSLE